MFKVGCGRRQESDVWSYFKYDAVKGCSKCLIADTTGAVCPALMQGKNTSNLKTHLKSTTLSDNFKPSHKLAYDACCLKDQALRPSKPPTPTSTQGGSGGILPTIMAAKGQHWSAKSSEALKREKALTAMIISTGLPVRMVEDPGFRTFCAALEPRFILPGKNNYLSPTVCQSPQSSSDLLHHLLTHLLKHFCSDALSKSMSNFKYHTAYIIS